MTSTAYVGGATSKSVTLTAYTASTGVPYTAGAYNTAGITAKYRRHGANAEVAITLATQTASGAYSSGGLVHISGGRYRLDVPDAAIAAGADCADVWVYGITDVVFTDVHIEILGGDPRAAAIDANMTKILGTAVSTPATAGILDVNVKNIDNDAASAAGTVTFPAIIASTTNITAGVITTVTNLTNAPVGMVVATGTLLGTHSATTADLGTNAPTVDITGSILVIEGRPPRRITSYATGTGVATFATVTSAPFDGDWWTVVPSAPVTLAPDAITAAATAADFGTEIAAAVLAAAAVDPIDANVEQINTVPVTGNGSTQPFNV